MSQSSTAATTVRTSEQSSTDVQTIVADNTIQLLLDVVGDADSRAILDATSEDVLTAIEISETCDLPLSTTYRKLDLLTDAGLLEERTRVRRSGKHASEYSRLVDDIVISLGLRGETEVQMSQGKPPEQTGSGFP